MKIIGITGSIASGKTTVANLMAGKKYPLFNADKIVSNLYKKRSFNNILIKKFKLNNEKKMNIFLRFLLSCDPFLKTTTYITVVYMKVRMNSWPYWPIN